MKINSRKVYKIDVPTMIDKRGSLAFMEGYSQVPFGIARFFYIFDVPEYQSRGDHAHRRNEQVHICLHGKLTVTLDDGESKADVELADPSEALYVGSMIWHTMRNFTKETVLLVLNSTLYSEEEYIRDYGEFQHLAKLNRF